MRKAEGLTTQERPFHSSLNPFTVDRFGLQQSVYADESVSSHTELLQSACKAVLKSSAEIRIYLLLLSTSGFYFSASVFITVYCTSHFIP